MTFLTLPVPWLEISIVVALVGALCVSRLRDPFRAWQLGLFFTALTFAGTILACASYYLCKQQEIDTAGGYHVKFRGQQIFGIDELNAPILSVVGLLHFLTGLATGRTKMRRFSMSWSLTSNALRLAIFGCIAPWPLIGLMALGTLPPYLELQNLGKSARVYALHMSLAVVLLALGWALVDPTGIKRTQIGWAVLPLLTAILIRCGTVPAHCWVTDWFEHASFGNALLFMTPFVGVYTALRLVLPYAPDWALHVIGIFSLITALYAAGMALVQQETRRFFAYLFISHSSLVLVGLELHTSTSLTGALALWISVPLSLTGLGLTLRALEARYGRLSLNSFHGLYEHSPALAVCFALTGLASVGFPCTSGFIGTELLVQGAVEASPYVGLAMTLAAALNGIAIVRVYFRLFTGIRHASTVSLNIGTRERIAVLTLMTLILAGGLFPQSNVSSCYRAAVDLLKNRQELSAPADATMQARSPRIEK